MKPPRSSSIRLALLTLLATMFSLGRPPALAGPAKYDPTSRSFRITYTFAALPSWGMTPDQIEGLGELQTATTAQDARIRALHQAVSLVIEDVTDKRARISSLDYVGSIKKADVVISLTGNFERAGWATQGTIDGRPGQVGLYYLYLDSRPDQEIVYTMAHELSHYLFGLPDEYSASPMAMCPLQNSESPGCLMDNYFLRHGYRKICQAADHNPDGPRTNAGTILQGTTAEDSCQLRIDNFFKEHPPGPQVDGDGDGVPDPTPGTSDSPVTPDEPFTGKFRQLVNSATLAVRDRFQADKARKVEKKQSLPQPSLDTFKKYAKDFLDKQLKELDSDPDFVLPTKDQLSRAVEVVAQKVLSDKQPIPARLKNQELLSRLRTKARELAGSTGKPAGQFLGLLLGNDGASKAKDLEPVIKKISSELLKFAFSAGMKALIGLAPPDQDTKREIDRYIDQIAREAVLGKGGATEFSTFVEAANLHIRLSLNAGATLNAIASELDLPGANLRRLNLDDLQARLDKFRLPGQPYTGFGYRRTYVVAPHPLDPRYDRVRIDAGDNFLYHDIRNLVAGQFMRLIRRERTEFVNDPLTADPITIVRLDALSVNPLLAGSSSGLRPNERSNEELTRALRPNERFAKQVSLFSKLIEEVRRDRVENIVILVPPGGLPQELSDVLEDFRSVVLDHPYLRVDVVLITGTIPLRLRDLVAQSGGTVQTAVDLDELGAVAQRLKNEVAAGSWVLSPQRGSIDFSAGARPDVAPPAMVKDPREALNFDKLRDRYGVANDTPEDKRRLWEKGEIKIYYLNEIVKDIETFYSHLREILEIADPVAQPEAYASITSGLSKLTRLNSTVKEFGTTLNRIAKDAPSSGTQRQIHELLEQVYEAKRSLRRIFGSTWLDGSPLTSTDDYMDWLLRVRLVQEAHRREVDREETGRRSTIRRDGRQALDALGRYRTIKSTIETRDLSTLNSYTAKVYVINTTQAGGRPRDFDRDPLLQELLLDCPIGGLRLFDSGDELKKANEEKPSEDLYLARALDELKVPADARKIPPRRGILREDCKGYLLNLAYPLDEEKRIATASDAIMQAYRRASVRSQRLWDHGRVLTSMSREYSSSEINYIENISTYLRYIKFRELYGAMSQPQPPRPEDRTTDLKERRDRIQEVIDSVDSLQREESLSNPHAPSLLLKASRVMMSSFYGEESPNFLTHANMLRMLMVTRLLERASQQAVDPIEFGKQVVELRRYVEKFRAAAERKRNDAKLIPRDGDWEIETLTKLINNDLPSIRLAELAAADSTFNLLDQRRENLLRGAILNDGTNRNASGPSNFEDAEILHAARGENALSASLELFQNNKRMDEALRTLRDARKSKDEVKTPNSRAQVPDEDSEVFISTSDKPEDVRDKIQMLIYQDFPTLMLDVLGRLRMFEDDITTVAQNMQQEGAYRPPYQRLTRSRSVPLPDLDRARDGSLLKIPLQPFQAEDGAEIELILGLSRPLSKFDQLREAPPTLQLYQGDRLVERPYLRFDAEVSTETMLVYRAPKPYLKAGLLGKGLYTPMLLIDRKFLPILSRENTVNYTFSVGTPRPNVQIIAGLRQPQPRDGDREFGKDRKEDAFRGTILANANQAIVEVQVLAGAPVIKAEVVGLFQWFDDAAKPIDSPNVEFLDNGTYPDLKKDDGIYTGSITLQPAAQRTPAEYRIFIQAKSTKDVRFIPLAEPILGSNRDDKKQDPDPPPVPEFQRASSINFRAQVEN